MAAGGGGGERRGGGMIRWYVGGRGPSQEVRGRVSGFRGPH